MPMPNENPKFERLMAVVYFVLGFFILAMFFYTPIHILFADIPSSSYALNDFIGGTVFGICLMSGMSKLRYFKRNRNAARRPIDNA